MTIPYKIARIETRQFAFFPDLLKNTEGAGVSSTFDFSMSADLSTSRCHSTFHYLQGDNTLLILEMNTYFLIAPEGIEEIKKNGSVPVDFLRYMGTIAVGTARGIVHAKTEGTVLNAIVLPPINLVEAIKEDLVVEQ